MNRRSFLVDTIGGLTLIAPVFARGQARPCPPPTFSIGDQQASTICGGATELARVASGLSAGQSAALGDTGLDSTSRYPIQWQNRFFYDSTRNLAFMLGKAEGGADYFVYRFDESTNGWTFSNSSTSEKGHIYESFGFDPATADCYLGKWAGSALKKVNPLTDTWTNPVTPNYGGGISPDIQTAMAWHPNLYGAGDGGLIVQVSVSASGRLSAWRKSTNSWADIGGATWTISGGDYGAYRGAVLYVRGGDYCISTTPAAAGGKTWKIPAGSGGSLGTATQMTGDGVPPVSCSYIGGSGGPVGALLDNPTGTNAPYILEKLGSSRVWKWNGSTWAEIGTHPFAGLSSDGSGWTAASCYPLGVFIGRGNTPAPMRVWKPAS